MGLLFEWHYQSKLAAAIDAIEHTLTGTWTGWTAVKMIPSILQDEFSYISMFDQAVYRQVLAEGASPGKAYLRKVEICLGYWKKLEEVLIQHRIQHNYQGTTAGLKVEVDILKTELDRRAAQPK